jgi:hypothetical protein
LPSTKDATACEVGKLVEVELSEIDESTALAEAAFKV